MPLPLIPANLDLIATSEEDVDIETESAVYQGQSYVLAVTVADSLGNPFDLGPTVTPEWDFDAQLRGDWRDRDSTVDAAFTVNVVDGPNGQIELKLTPTQTAALVQPPRPRWDCFMTNKTVGGNPDYDAGFSQMLFRGKWKLELRATEA